KAQAIGNFRNAPGSLLQQALGFLRQAAANEGGSRVARRLLQHAVEVVDVHGQLVGIVGGGAQAQRRLRAVARKLPRQQLRELGGYSLGGAVRSQGGRGRL